MTLVPTARVPATVASGDLRPLVAAWLLAYASDHTRQAYGRDVADWLGWCAEHEIQPLIAARAHVDAWARWLEREGRSPATVARRLSALASFYRYAEDEGVVARSPVARVRRPKVAGESPTLGLDREELRRFLDAAEQAGPRDHVLALLLAVNGLRVSEALALSASDLDTVRGHCTVTLTGKGGRRDLVPLPPLVCDALRTLLNGRDDGPVLLANDGQPLDRHDASRVIRRVAHAAGITKRISPHSLRHSAITAALDAGVPLRDVQDFARHQSPVTTRRYDRGRHSLDRHASYAVAQFVTQ